MQTAMTQTQPGGHALVVGLGLTGLSCARFLSARGWEVSVVDSRIEPPKARVLSELLPQVSVHTGGFDPQLFTRAQMIVLSPGVPLDTAPVAAAVVRGVPVVGDVELFAREAGAPVLAITGSNGKSTVTALVGEMCRAGDVEAQVGGNIGVPALDLLSRPVPRVYVLELSSFQLETTVSLRPLAATVLNVSADHLDRYPGLREYAHAKERIFAGEGTMVVNAEDPQVMNMVRQGRQTVRFGLGEPRGEHDYGLLQVGREEWIARGATPLMPAREVALAGRHNLANVAAAMALAGEAGVGDAAMAQAARHFTGLPHRCQPIAERRGVRYIDDSKGTNVGATVAALRGMVSPVVLIAGGDGKGQDFNELLPALHGRVRAVVLMGRDAKRIAAVVCGEVPCMFAVDMHDAVGRAARMARPGDVVLLSPACSSLDMFRDYTHRGAAFSAAVEALGP